MFTKFFKDVLFANTNFIKSTGRFKAFQIEPFASGFPDAIEIFLNTWLTRSSLKSSSAAMTASLMEHLLPQLSFHTILIENARLRTATEVPDLSMFL